MAHGILQGSGNLQLSTLMALANESGVWTNTTLCHILSNNMPDVEKGTTRSIVCCIAYAVLTLCISMKNKWLCQQSEVYFECSPDICVLCKLFVHSS